MRKLAIMTMGAVLALSAQTSGTSGVNRTGQTERSATSMQTGSAATPGTGEDTTQQQPQSTTAPDADRAADTDPFRDVQPADSGAAPYGSERPGTTGTAQAPSSSAQQQRQPAGTFEQQVEPAEPAPGATSQQQSQQSQQSQQTQPAQPAQPGQATTTDPFGQVEPADSGAQAQQPGAGMAERTLPAAAGNWLALLLGGGFLSAAGLALRRRRE